MPKKNCVSRTVTMPVDLFSRVDRYCEREQRNFSNGAAYLLKMGLLYVEQVLPDVNAGIVPEKAPKVASAGRSP